MDIIQFLIQDHDRLRADALQIRKHLKEKIVREKIKKYIAHFERHEWIEDKFLLGHLKNIAARSEIENLMHEYEKNHREIWKSLNHLMQDVDNRDFQMLRTDFFNFSEIVERHGFSEERLYFPIFSQYISPPALEELGQKSREYYDDDNSCS